MCWFCEFLEKSVSRKFFISSILTDLKAFVTDSTQIVVIDRAIDHFVHKRNYIAYGKFCNLIHNNTILQDHFLVNPAYAVHCKYIVDGYEKHCYSH
jgi:hypothetical protein